MIKMKLNWSFSKHILSKLIGWIACFVVFISFFLRFLSCPLCCFHSLFLSFRKKKANNKKQKNKKQNKKKTKQKKRINPPKQTD